MKELYTANYIIALSADAVTEADRAEYRTTFEDFAAEDYLRVYQYIVKTVLEAMKGGVYDADTAKSRLAEEYAELGLADILGTYGSACAPLVDALVDDCLADLSGLERDDLIRKLRSYTDLADFAGETAVCNGIYYAMLVCLVNRQLIPHDLEFSRKVTEVVRGVDVTDAARCVADNVNFVLG